MSIEYTQTVASTSPSVSLAETGIVSTFLVWMRRASQRRDLELLTDHELADMGLTDHQVAQEAAKPFWQA